MNKLTLELFKLYVKMPSDPDFNLANNLSSLKEKLLVGFASLKRELSEEKRLRSTASSTPKFKKKSSKKQFEVIHRSSIMFSWPLHFFCLRLCKLKKQLKN